MFVFFETVHQRTVTSCGFLGSSTKLKGTLGMKHCGHVTNSDTNMTSVISVTDNPQFGNRFLRLITQIRLMTDRCRLRAQIALFSPSLRPDKSLRALTWGIDNLL